MAVRIVRLGTPRRKGEGLRIGTVRRPPRGVAKSEFAKRDYYDVWLPLLSPSAELVAYVQKNESATAWAIFRRKFRNEVNNGEGGRVLDLLAALSFTANFSMGCYCEVEDRCHRSVLRELLAERGAKIV